MGRALPTGEQSGAPNQRRVLMFYYVWHQRQGGGGPYDISKIIAGKTQPFADAAFGPSPAFHHWGEPALGYYDINDEFVLRRHAQLLADAQVDAVVLDVTNAATYDATWKKLCAIYANLRAFRQSHARHQLRGEQLERRHGCSTFTRSSTRRASAPGCCTSFKASR